MARCLGTFVCALVVGLAAQGRADEPAVLRAGMIGLDTSHSVVFTQILHAPDAPALFRTVKVVAAVPGGSPDIESSISKVPEYRATLEKEHGVRIVDTIEELLPLVDVVLLESVDGRPHLKQAEPVLRAGKPLFIDKPMAGSLADAIRIFEISKETGTPCFSSSALRFAPTYAGLAGRADIGQIVGCASHGPCALEPHHPDLFWYGIHGVEGLFTVLGPDCEQVTRVKTPGADVVTGVWKDGRVGTFRGIRDGHSDFGAVVYGTNGIVHTAGFAGYEPLIEQICTFFQTRKPPVTAEETLAILAFMEAADESARRGGVAVRVADVMAAARSEAQR